MKSFKQIIFTIVMISITQILWADAPVDNPARVQTPCGLSDDMNCFEDGKTAYAPEVNANFKVLYDRIQKFASEITILDNGNVGIGISKPSAKLHVSGDLTTSANLIMTGRAPHIRQSTNDRQLTLCGGSGWKEAGAAIDLRGVDSSYNAYGMEIYTGGRQSIAIDKNSNVAFTGNVIMAGGDPFVKSINNDRQLSICGGSGWKESGAVIALRGANSHFNAHGIEIYTGDRQSIAIDKNSNVAITGTVTAQNFPATSDIRFKKDIAPLNNSLTKTLALKPVYFKWKTEKYKKKHFSTKTQIGFIANDVETIIPESVHTDQKGIKYIDYGKITPVIVGAIQDLNTKISDLEKENKALKKKLAAYDQLALRIALLEMTNQRQADKSVAKIDFTEISK